MKSNIKLYLERAANEFRLAKTLFNLSKTKEDKIKLGANSDDTFYSATISHSYYAIFYSAKAILLTKKLKIKGSEVHKKTFEKFKEVFVDTGILDTQLLKIYKKMIVRADQLLHIFKQEKWKRGHFTYKTLPQANIEPAKSSIQHAKIFLSNVKKICQKMDGI